MSMFGWGRKKDTPATPSKQAPPAKPFPAQISAAIKPGSKPSAAAPGKPPSVAASNMRPPIPPPTPPPPRTQTQTVTSPSSTVEAGGDDLDLFSGMSFATEATPDQSPPPTSVPSTPPSTLSNTPTLSSSTTTGPSLLNNLSANNPNNELGGTSSETLSLDGGGGSAFGFLSSETSSSSSSSSQGGQTIDSDPSSGVGGSAFSFVTSNTDTPEENPDNSGDLFGSLQVNDQADPPIPSLSEHPPTTSQAPPGLSIGVHERVHPDMMSQPSPSHSQLSRVTSPYSSEAAFSSVHSRSRTHSLTSRFRSESTSSQLERDEIGTPTGVLSPEGGGGDWRRSSLVGFPPPSPTSKSVDSGRNGLASLGSFRRVSLIRKEEGGGDDTNDAASTTTQDSEEERERGRERERREIEREKRLQKENEIAAAKQREEEETRDIARAINGVNNKLNEELVSFFNSVKNISETQTSLRERELRMSNEVRELRTKLKERETAQAAAIAEEEYDKAHEIDAIIDKLKKNLQDSTNESERLRTQLKKLEEEKTDHSLKISNILTDCSGKYKKLKEKQEKELETFSTTQRTILEKQEDDLTSGFDANERSLSHIIQDLAEVNKQQQAIETAIATDSKDVADEKAKLESEQSLLEIELADLKKKVLEKEAEIRACKQKKSAADAKIAQVRDNHERKLKRVKEKINRIQKEQAIKSREKEALEQERALLEGRQKSVKEKEIELKGVIGGIGSQLRDSELIIKRISTDQDRRKKWQNAVDSEIQNSNQLLKSFNACKTGIEDLKAELVKLETEVSSHHQNIANINLRIPSLQAEKNVAVRTRNFKQAATLSKEIKDLTTSKQESESALDSLKLSVASNTQRLESDKTNLEAIQKKINEAEEKVDLSRLTGLISAQRTLQKVAKESEGATGESNPLSQAQRAEKLWVEAELLSITREITQIRAKHTWSNDYPHVPEEKEETTRTSSFDESQGLSQERTAEAKHTFSSSSSSSSSFSSLSQSLPSTTAFVRTPSAPAPPSATQIEESLNERNKLIEDIDELGKRINTAVESEEYETADNLEQEVSEAKSRLSTIEKFLTENNISFTPRSQPQSARTSPGGGGTPASELLSPSPIITTTTTSHVASDPTTAITDGTSGFDLDFGGMSLSGGQGTATTIGTDPFGSIEEGNNLNSSSGGGDDELSLENLLTKGGQGEDSGLMSPTD